MPAYDSGFKIVARVSAREGGTVAGVPSDEWQPIGDTLQTTERLADRAFRIRYGQKRFVVYMEASTRWDKNAPWNLLAKSGLLSEREHLPTLCLVFILQRCGYRPQGGQFHLEASTGPTQHLWYKEVYLWEVVPEPWWDSSPGLMALYPLGRHNQPRREAVTHAAQAIRAKENDPSLRADLLTTLGIFGKLAYPDLDVFELIGRQAMKESKFYQEKLAEGAVERARTDVIQAISFRFGPAVANKFETAVKEMTDSDLLTELHRAAIQSRRIADLRRAFTELSARA
jgi:hypothetical protein